MKFRIGTRCWYTPDFVVSRQLNDSEWSLECHEVKGHWEDDARVKVRAVAALWPDIRWVGIQKQKGQWVFEEFT